METRKRRPDESSEGFDPPKIKKTKKDYSKDYRDRIKEDESYYKLFRKYETARIQAFRARASEESKNRNRELQRIRQQQYRKRKKENEEKLPKRKKTRTSVEKQRAQWREQKRKRSSTLTYQKRVALNKKRREKYALKNKAMAIPSDQANMSETSVSGKSEGKSSGATRVAKSRYKKKLMESLPKDVDLKAEVLQATISEQTPKTKKAIHQKLGVLSPSVRKKLFVANDIKISLKSTLSAIAKARNKKDLRLKRLIAKAVMVKVKNGISLKKLGISGRLSKRVEATSTSSGFEDYRQKRKDALPQEITESVASFFQREDVSHSIPNARSGIKNNGEVEARTVMESSLRTAYEQYKEKYAHHKVSYSAFTRLRPARVMPFTSHKFRECLCEYCVNVELKLKALNTFLSANGHADLNFADKYAVSRMTLCPKPTGHEYKKACLDRQCVGCGVNLVEELLQPATEQYSCTPIRWFRWEKAPDATGSSRMMKIPKESVLSGLVEELLKELKPFSVHLFNAKWQYEQYKIVTAEVPSDVVVFCMDFGENYTCKAQDAPQGFHWTNMQCTIHPVVSTYMCPTCEEKEVVTDSIIFISDDLSHDQHAVQHFYGQSIKLLLEEEGIRFTTVVQFSDGAPTQYKSKLNFVDCSYSYEDFGIKNEKHFFGSRHGKGPCDREIGVVKKSMNLAVAAGNVDINCAKEMFTACNERLSLPKNASHVHTKRRFKYVEKGEIDRSRPSRSNVKPLKDTRKMHCVVGVQPHVIMCRERSCFCKGCTEDRIDDCEYRDITGEWKVVSMPQHHTGQQRQEAAVSADGDARQPIADVANEQRRGPRGGPRTRGVRGGRGIREARGGSGAALRTRGARAGLRTGRARAGLRTRGARGGPRIRNCRRGPRTIGARGERGRLRSSRNEVESDSSEEDSSASLDQSDSESTGTSISLQHSDSEGRNSLDEAESKCQDQIFDSTVDGCESAGSGPTHAAVNLLTTEEPIYDGARLMDFSDGSLDDINLGVLPFSAIDWITASLDDAESQPLSGTPIHSMWSLPASPSSPRTPVPPMSPVTLTGSISVEQTAPMDLTDPLDQLAPVNQTDPLDQPASVNQTDPLDQPAPVNQTDPLDQPAPVNQTDPLDQPAPVNQTDPLDQPASVNQTDPLDQPASVNQTDPLDQPAPVNQTDPLDQPASVNQTDPLDQPASVNQTDPLDQPASVNQTDPLDQPAPVNQTDPLDQPASVNQTDPLDQTAFVSQTGLVGQTAFVSQTDLVGQTAFVSQTDLVGQTAFVSQTDLVGQTASVSQTDLVGQTASVNQTDLVGQTASVNQTDLVGQTASVNQTDLVGQTASVNQTDLVGQTASVHEKDPENRMPAEAIKYSIGSYVLVKHGSDLLPAVITRHEDTLDYLEWVQFFHQKKKKFHLEPKEFTVLHSDIMKVLPPPDLKWAGGSRFYYQFSI